jgi:hypothetical protein
MLKRNCTVAWCVQWRFPIQVTCRYIKSSYWREPFVYSIVNSICIVRSINFLAKSSYCSQWAKSFVEAAGLQIYHFKSQHFTISLTVQYYRTSLLTVSVLGSLWRPYWCLPAVRFAAFTVKENFLSDLRCKHIWELILGKHIIKAGHCVQSRLLRHPGCRHI